MSARTELAARLTEVLPGVRVIDHAVDPTLDGPAVMVYTHSVADGSTPGTLLYTLDVVVMTARQVDGDDELEATLEDVLEAIEAWPTASTWTGATYDPTSAYPAFVVTVEVFTQRPAPEPDPEPEPEPEPEPDPED